MNQEELNKLNTMYDKMYEVCVQTLNTVDAITEHHTEVIGKLKYIQYARYKMEINALKVYLKNYMNLMRPISILKEDVK